MCELNPDGEVSVYVEGLLVQKRDPKEVMYWSENFGMRDITEELNYSFYSKYDEDRNKPWAYHFKDMDGYALIKTLHHLPTKKSETTVLVSLNERRRDAPTLQVICHVSHNKFSVEFVASLAALARYYSIDDTILGEESAAVPNKGNDGSSN